MAINERVFFSEESKKQMEIFKKRIARLPLNLQFFADGEADGGEDTGETGEDDKESNNEDDNADGEADLDDGDEGEEKETLFKQNQVNAIASKEVKKAQNKLMKQLGVTSMKEAKEKLGKLSELEEKNLSDSDKVKKKLTELEDQNKTLAKEKQDLDDKFAALNADVDKGSVDDVIVLARNLVDDDTSMEDAIQSVLKKYPHFKNANSDDEDKDDSEKVKKPKFSEGNHSKGKDIPDSEKWGKAFSWGQS